MKNLEQFNQITISVLGKLYDAFPNPIEFTETEFDKLTFQSTVDFLSREGFVWIRVDGRTYGVGNFSYEDVVLTLKGLSILNSVPESLNEKKSLGQKMSEIVKQGTKQASLESLKVVVGELIKGAINF